MNPTSGTASARSTLLSMEDQYNKRIDDDISKLVDCFADIVKIGEVKNNTYNTYMLIFIQLIL